MLQCQALNKLEMAAEAQIQRQVKFAKTFIAHKILQNNEDLHGLQLIKAKAAVQRQLNGFMSNIVNLKLILEHPKTKSR